MLESQYEDQPDHLDDPTHPDHFGYHPDHVYRVLHAVSHFAADHALKGSEGTQSVVGGLMSNLLHPNSLIHKAPNEAESEKLSYMGLSMMHGMLSRWNPPGYRSADKSKPALGDHIDRYLDDLEQVYDMGEAKDDAIGRGVKMGEQIRRHEGLS